MNKFNIPLIFLFIVIFDNCVLSPVDTTILAETLKVKIGPGSDGGLIAGNEKITGLNPNKYYIIEELNEAGNSLNIRYVAADGSRTADFDKIGMVTGGAITGLNNDYTYIVKGSNPVTGIINYGEGTVPVATTPATANSSGVVTLNAPAAGNNLYMDINIPPPALPAASGTYQLIEAPIPTPAAGNTPISSPFGIRQLRGNGSTTDYVFADIVGGEPVRLFVLRVRITNPASVTLSVSWTITDQAGTLTPVPPTLSKTDLLDSTGSYTVVLTGAPVGTTSYEWRYNGAVVSTNNILQICDNSGNINNPDYLLVGDHIFTVVITVNGTLYSKYFILTVTP